MNAIMFVIVGLVGLTVATALVAAGRTAFGVRSWREGPILSWLGDRRGFSKILALPLIVWALLFLVLLIVLLLVSAVALLYVFALFHGEWFQLLDSIPKTAGNIVVHLIYPLQVLLFAVITFYMAVGAFQLVFGPAEKLTRVGLRIADTRHFTSRLAGILAIVTGMEAVKILLYSLLVKPENLHEFFARSTMPKAEPIGMVLLAVAVLVGVAAFWRNRGETE
jgi:hypothetical protein